MLEGHELVIARYKYLIYVTEIVVILIISYAVGGLLLGPWLSDIFPSAPNRTIGMLSSSTFSPLATSLYAMARFKNIKPSINKRDTVRYTLIGIVLSAATSLASLYIVGNHVISINEIWSLGRGYFIVSVFLLTVLGPTLEEILFRGYLYELLAKELSSILSLIIVSLLFYLIHAILGGFSIGTFFTLIFSVVFTFAYINGGLIASMISHILANTLLFIACSYW